MEKIVNRITIEWTNEEDGTCAVTAEINIQHASIQDVETVMFGVLKDVTKGMIAQQLEEREYANTTAS